ncbi:hypothetical protein KAS79_03850 [Candidatus Parcubacteria bacterium]|nr:hypothetical protein [Candidatus Parcubacteria bacterium]
MNTKPTRNLYTKQTRNFWFCVGLVFLLFGVGLAQPVRAEGASLCLSPSQGSYNIGQSFSVNIMLNTDGAAVNAAQAVLYYPSAQLKVIKVSKTNSIFGMWVKEPVYSNGAGTIIFGGGLPSPGYTGSSGKVLNVIFQGKFSGQAKLYFGKEIILADDGRGTNIFKLSKGGSYFINISEKIKIDTEPPEPFEIIVDNEGYPANPHPLLYFEAKDDDSGINHYEIKIGEQDILTLMEPQANPYKIPLQEPGVYTLEVKAIDNAGNAFTAFSEINVESIPAPEVAVCPETFISGEEVFHIEGTAAPGYTVIVFFEKAQELIKKWETKSNEKGDWLINEDGLFKSGKYIISAKAKDALGAISYPSKEYIVKVILSGFVLGPWFIDYSLFNLLLLILLLILLIILIYLFFRIINTQRAIKRESKDLKNKFYKEYNELCKDIELQLKLFRKAKQQRALTEEEKQAEKELLKNLADIERVIKKELKDIEEI